MLSNVNLSNDLQLLGFGGRVMVSTLCLFRKCFCAYCPIMILFFLFRLLALEALLRSTPETPWWKRPASLVWLCTMQPRYTGLPVQFLAFWHLYLLWIYSSPLTNLFHGKIQTVVFICVFSQTETSECTAALFAGMEAGWLKPVIGPQYSLDKVAQAHEDIIGSSGASGKMILIMWN